MTVFFKVMIHKTINSQTMQERLGSREERTHLE
jgi:hypothetical protein